MSLKLENNEFYLYEDGSISINDFANQLLKILDNKIKPVAHISKELHYDIIKTIKAYHTDDITKHYIDNAYNNKDNN